MLFLEKNAFLLNKYTETQMTGCAKVVEMFNLKWLMDKKFTNPQDTADFDQVSFYFS